jgi:hypothetical protein
MEGETGLPESGSTGSLRQVMMEHIRRKTVRQLIRNTAALVCAVTVMLTIYPGAAYTASAQQTGSVAQTPVTLGFAGDINLSEDWCSTQYLNTCPNGIADCISPDIAALTNGCSLFMLNNEFTYSKRGTPLPGKAYTFRADPSRVGIVKQLGTDVVLMANNHVYDYGKDAFLDTLDTLKGAGIPYTGAGRSLNEAETPVYFNVNGVRIAYVAASRAEKNIMTPEAGTDSPGILRTYDETKYLDVIRNAKANADYVVASVHWGTEYSNKADRLQKKLAREFIDAGADAVIGTHPHVLQGMEYYKGRPIMYSLGNFWFNEKTLYTCVLVITVARGPDGGAALSQVQFVPCIQKGFRTYSPQDAAERQKIIDFEKNISFGVDIDKNGMVTAK